MIIGLTGENGGGKNVVADYLEKHGFKHLSLSDVVRDQIAGEGKPVTREGLIETANRMRREGGPAALASKLLEQVFEGSFYVAESFRTPSEVEAFRKKKDFVLVYVRATPEVRFERIKNRRRESDPRTFKEFTRIEKLEFENRDPSKQSISDCIKLADEVLDNNGDLEILYSHVDNLLAKLSAKTNVERPSWDEYFMEIARVVSKRGTCRRGAKKPDGSIQLAASVLVRERRILSTGYVGSPKGLPHCLEHGCDTINNHCVRTMHSEQNALVQCALHGISSDGATLYVTFNPCLICSKLLINAGIKRVVYEHDYFHADGSDDKALDYLKQAGVVVEKFISLTAN